MPDLPLPQKLVIKFDSLARLEKDYEQQISKGGYFVASDQPLPRTTQVELAFHLPGQPQPLAVRAEVVMAATPTAPMPGMGAGMVIQFEKLSPMISNAFKAAITIAKIEGMDAGKAEVPAPTAAGEGPAEEEEAQPLGGAEDGEDQPEDQSEDQDEEIGEVDENDQAIRDIITKINTLTGDQLYFILRKLPLHQKVAAAKRGNRTVRNILLQEGQKKILQFMLQNPQMTVPEVIVMLKMPNLSLDCIQFIAKNSTFNQSEEVKYFIVINPKTPLPLSLTVINSLNLQNIAKIAKSQAVKPQLKSSALKLLELRRK